MVKNIVFKILSQIGSVNCCLQSLAAEVVINLQRKKRNFAHSVNSKPVHQEKNIVFSGLLVSHFLFVYHIDKRKLTSRNLVFTNNTL